MTPRTITTTEMFSNNILHLQAQDQPNSPINIIAVLKPYVDKGYKVIRYATDVVKGSMQASLIR